MMILKIIVLAAFAITSLFSCSGKSMVRMYPVDTTGVTQLPDDSLLYKTVRDRLQFGYGKGDFDNFILLPGDSALGRSRGPGGNRSLGRVSIEASIELLAWQKSRVSGKYVWNGKEVILYNALLWSAYKDSSGAFKWALILATKDEGLAGYISWKLVKAGPGNPIQHYSESPTNEDISTLLSSMSAIENHLFVQDSLNVNRDYGVPLEFIDGDVFEKTWEAAIGEKPTRFFPNGK